MLALVAAAVAGTALSALATAVPGRGPAAPPAPNEVNVTVNTRRYTHRLNPLHLGCHSDSGFAHTERGFYSQMIFGESFEFNLSSSWDYTLPTWDAVPAAGTPGGLKWNRLIEDPAGATVGFDATEPHHGYSSLKVTSTVQGTSFAGVTNRGIGNEGLHLVGGREYEGYAFYKAAKPVKLRVALRNYVTGEVLAHSIESAPAVTAWTRFNFSLTPFASTNCTGIAPGSDPEVQCGQDCLKKKCMAGPPAADQGHICVKCAGEFAIGLVGAGEVNVDYVFLQPGNWGRFGSGPFLKSGVDTLVAMGITAIRLGGSFTDPSYYFWKYWRGDPWERKSLGAKWGSELVSGFGPFEFVEMCEEAGIEPIVTTTAQWGDHMGPDGSNTCCNATDMADLVEYCYGNESTTWGALRAADGHPAPYKVRFFELGNEQYNTFYPDQVRAMEERAAAVGVGGQLFYMSPHNGDWLNASQAAEVEALGLKDHVVADLHVGAGGGVERAQQLFDAWPKYTMGAVNAETNDGTHTMLRAVKEMADLNDWFNCAEDWCTRLHFRTASFCNERSGHFDAFDQGISMFLPNMSWIQPPGYVHVMIKHTWATNALPVAVGNASGGACQFYAFWEDHGCRWWDEQQCDEAPSGKVVSTLWNRTGENTFEKVATGQFCNDPPAFMDGPGATPTDDACRARCVAGERNQASTGLSVSAQATDENKLVVIRLANAMSAEQVVTLELPEPNRYQEAVDVWTLSAPDPLAANTPAEPEKVSPVKSRATLGDAVLVPPTGVVTVVLQCASRSCM